MATGTGYQAIQSTRPQSLAYGLTDSPAGLAGWIVEKFQAWSDCDGDITSVFTLDRLLENLSIYWFTGTINSSMRLYHEAMVGTRRPFPTARSRCRPATRSTPVSCSTHLDHWADGFYRITHWTTMPRGGHFAAMEVPDLYAADLLAFTSAL